VDEAERHVEDVRKAIEADDEALGLARARRNRVFEVAGGFPGVLRTAPTGSLAAGLVNDPVEDGDGVMVVDRRCYTALGPEGAGEGPHESVADLQEMIGPKLREEWPNLKVFTMKRGLTICFNDPLTDGQDPYVDLVFALNRSDGNGLWIPNMDLERWDASDPEEHVRLFTDGSRALRRTRARATRLAKAWNKQYKEPAFSSFNLTALALESIVEPAPIHLALTTFFSEAARSLERGLTEDPAGVSGAIQLELTKPIALERLRAARDGLLDACADDDTAAAALHGVFWKYLPEPAVVTSKRALADVLRGTTPRVRGVAPAAAMIAGALKPQRAYGGSDLGACRRG
jgi:hypothetical protein